MSGGQIIGPFKHKSFQRIFRTDFFRIDFFDILVVQGTVKSLHQHHSSKALIFQCSAFFIVQVSHPYMTTGKTIGWTRWTFLAKSYLCFLICCLGWSQLFFKGNKRLLISWLQSPSAVFLEPKEIKSFTVSTVFPSTGRGQFSFQSQRKAMPKNVQITAPVHSSHTLAK